MLKKMALKHFEFVRSAVIEGATLGAFDRQLAGHDADRLFFDGLKRAIETGLLAKSGAGMQRFWGYVYFNPAQAKDQPLGFAMLCGDGKGQVNEFWMAAIHQAYRNRGLGKLLFSEVLAAEGKSNLMCRCNQGSEIAMNMLLKLGFLHVTTGDEGTRFLIDPRMEKKFQDAIKGAARHH